MTGYTRAEMVNDKARLYELGGTLPDQHYKWDKKKSAAEAASQPLDNAAHIALGHAEASRHKAKGQLRHGTKSVVDGAVYGTFDIHENICSYMLLPSCATQALFLCAHETFCNARTPSTEHATWRGRNIAQHWPCICFITHYRSLPVWLQS
jgi:hypothetical protein